MLRAKLRGATGGAMAGPAPRLRLVSIAGRWTRPQPAQPMLGDRRARLVASVGPGVSPSGASNEESLELTATRLREAEAKIGILTQQVSIVEELQLQMSLQDELIGELEMLIENDRAKQDTERESLGAQLAAAQQKLAATTTDLEEARAKLSTMPDILQLQSEVARLREAETLLEAAQTQLLRLAELDVLAQQVAGLQGQLQEASSSGAAKAAELEAAKEALAAAHNATVAAELEAQEAQQSLARKVEELAAIEADVETMRKTMSKAGKKAIKAKVPPAKGAKGFASPPTPATGTATATGTGTVAAPASTPAKADAGAENHLRQELKQAQTELEQLQTALEEREAALQAAQSAVDFLTSQCKEQEVQMEALTAQLADLAPQLAARMASEAALEQQVAALSVKLRAEANDKHSSVEALKRELEVQMSDRVSLASARTSLAAEAEGLRVTVRELEGQRRRQEAAIGDLDESLQDLREEVESAQQLKVDLAILAEAFSSKESELQAEQERLADMEAHEGELRAQLAEAEAAMATLNTALTELQTFNSQLAEKADSLDAAFRARSEQAAEEAARAAEAGKQLAEAHEQVFGLESQLNANAKALADTAAALSEAQAAEASQRTAAQTLSERLAAEQAAVIQQSRDVEALREQVAMLNEQIVFLSGSDSSMRKLQDALRRSDGEVAALRDQLGAAAKAAQAAEETAREAAEEKSLGNRDLDRLQGQLSAATSSLAEREQALAAAQGAVEATEAELRGAMRQVEAANAEVQTMRTQVQLLSSELTAVRQDRDAASRAEFEGLRLLQQELSAEAAATLELLNKAESLVMVASDQATASTTAEVNNVLQQARNDLDVQTELWESERQRSASLEREVTALQEQLRNAALGRRLGAGDESAGGAGGGNGSSLAGTLAAAFSGARGGGGGSYSAKGDMEAANVRLLDDLTATRDGVLAAKAESEALQTRVAFLERELRSRDALITELRSSSIGPGRGSRQADSLVQQLKTLQEENTKLKQSAARQQQLLNQTKRFFEKKVGTTIVTGGDPLLAATTSTTAKRAGGGPGANPNKNGVP